MWLVAGAINREDRYNRGDHSLSSVRPLLLLFRLRVLVVFLPLRVDGS
jgi:hypothetical protein